MVATANLERSISPDDLVGIKEIADVAGVSVRTISQRAKDDGLEILTGVNLRRRYLRREDAEFLLRARPIRRDSGPERAETS